jgi:hypothetical protein
MSVEKRMFDSCVSKWKGFWRLRLMYSTHELCSKVDEKLPNLSLVGWKVHSLVERGMVHSGEVLGTLRGGVSSGSVYIAY